MTFFAVAKGRKPGIYETREEFEEQVDGFPGAFYNKFETNEEAVKFMIENSEFYESFQSGEPSNKRAKKFDFEKTSDGSIVAYIHGAWYRGNSAGLGVFWEDDHPDNVSRLLDGRRSIYRAGIQAAITAICIAKQKGYKRIVIRTGSEYIINSATCSIKRWLENGWKTIADTPVKDRQDFEEYLNVKSAMEVKWEQVQEGTHGYDMAVKLAHSGEKIQKEKQNFLDAKSSEVSKTGIDLIDAIGLLKKPAIIGSERGIDETREEYVDEFAEIQETAKKNIEDSCILKGVPSYQGEPFKKLGKRLYFEVTSDGSIVAYIHGDWVNGEKESSVGFSVFWGDNHPENVSQLLDEMRAGNQPRRAEIQAAIIAIQYAIQNGYKRIVIRTSSDYLINSATKSNDHSLEKDWTKSNEPTNNNKDFQELINVMDGMALVTWEKVHREIYGYYKAIMLFKDIATN